MLGWMAEPVQALQKQTATPARLSKAKVIVIKIIVLTAISLGLGFAHNWASARYYQPDHVAGFHTGLLEGNTAAAHPRAEKHRFRSCGVGPPLHGVDTPGAICVATHRPA